MDSEPLGTDEATDFPTVRQLSVFVENRVGQLMRLTKLFDRTDVHILALSVVYSIDCAIIRLLVDDPDEAAKILRENRFPCSETELLVVSVPHGKRGLLNVWAALLRAETSIYYAYPLLIHHRGSSALAVHPDDIEGAAQALADYNFEVLNESDLKGDI